jgi:hypothetical protein
MDNPETFMGNIGHKTENVDKNKNKKIHNTEN